MAPTIVRHGQFRLFFFSREEARIHVHVAHPEGEAKFWLTPSVHLAKNVGLSSVQIRQAQAVVEAHIKEIQDAWNRHFGG
jgi:DNA-directed RNA polymerase